MTDEATLVAAPVGYTTVSASRVTDSSGNLISNATISFQPCDYHGNWYAYCINNQGQAMWESVSTQVVNGAFSIVLADTQLTSPQNIFFNVRIIDNVSNTDLLGPKYLIQPTGSWWSFDNFIPNVPDLPPVLGALAGDVFFINFTVKEQEETTVDDLNKIMGWNYSPVPATPKNVGMIKSPVGTQYMLSRVPTSPMLIGLYYNGVLLLPVVHYTLVGQVFTLSFATSSGDNLYASYMASTAA